MEDGGSERVQVRLRTRQRYNVQTSRSEQGGRARVGPAGEPLYDVHHKTL